MLPRFTLPPAEAGATLNLATKPKQVAAWLERLPYANPVEACAELTDFLATCARLRLSAERLDDVLEHILPTASHLVEALKERFAGDSLPLAQNRQQAAELCVRLMLEIGHICKLIILSRVGKRFQLFGAKPLDRHVYVLLQSLSQVIETSLETHPSPPAGAGSDMHQAYAFALNNGWSRVTPAVYDDAPCLEDIYKYTLLFALADPFRIPREEMAATRQLVLQWCSQAELLPGDDTSRHGSVFAIDQESDNPVIVLSRTPQQYPGQWQLLLNTTQLVKRLSLLASQYARDIKPNGGPAGAPQDLVYLDMLHRLRSQWGGSVQRMGYRRARYEAARYEVLFGLQAIHKVLRGVDEGMASSPFTGVAAPADCMLVNDSVGGLALAKDRPVGFQLKIGDVAAVRHGRAERWSIGIVRWFRATRTGKAIFGLQLLAPGATGVALRDEDEGGELNCLWLPATPSLRQGEMVLCQGGRLGVGARLTLSPEQGGEPRRIRLEQLAELTPSIEAYRFSG